MTARARISSNVSRIGLSAIMEMSMRGAAVPDAVSLAWGLPSFPTPLFIRDAVTRALASDPDVGKYALSDGLPALREQVVRTHRALTGVEMDPHRNVVVTAGNMEGLNVLLHVLLEPGDEVIVTDPGFVSHLHQIRLCGGVPVSLPMDESRGWALDLDALPGLLSERTRAIVLVSPSNPTGKIFAEAELHRMVQLCSGRDLVFLIDDPYSPFTYENRSRYFNLASDPALADRVAYLFTFSKAYAMTGWRVGYMIVPEALKREVLKVHNATMICSPRVSQVAALAALSEGIEHLRDTESILARRRELICDRLADLPHVFDYVKPEGAYYVFPRIVAAHQDSRGFCLDALERARVVLAPGSAFGARGEHHVRMAYCVEDEVIDTAFDRLETTFPA